MLPSAVVVLASLPFTPNGKVDRQALPAPERPVSAPAGRAASELEARLAAIWAEVLELDHVGIHDNFFELGGYSLKAFQVIARVRAVVGVDIASHSLFTAPTVAQLAQVVADEQLAHTDPDLLARLLREIQDLTPESARGLLANSI
jgi:acyl carrier protein